MPYSVEEAQRKIDAAMREHDPVRYIANDAVVYNGVAAIETKSGMKEPIAALLLNKPYLDMCLEGEADWAASYYEVVLQHVEAIAEMMRQNIADIDRAQEWSA